MRKKYFKYDLNEMEVKILVTSDEVDKQWQPTLEKACEIALEKMEFNIKLLKNNMKKFNKKN